MLSFEVKNEINSLADALNTKTYFMVCLEKIASYSQTINSYVKQIAQLGVDANTISNFKNHLAGLKKTVNEISPKQFFTSMHSIQEKVRKSSLLSLHTDNNSIINKIDIFSDLYERYISNYSHQDAFHLIAESKDLTTMLHAYRYSLLTVGTALESNFETVNNDVELSIFISFNLSLRDFSQKLLALNCIYDELCMVLDISLSEYPLTIRKIESGSLWVKLFGNIKIIELMIDFIKHGAAYLYRNYTDEGKISTIPKKLDSLNSILDFSKKLEEQGISTEKINGHIQKSAIRIAEELNTLLSGQPEIVVNAETISIGNELQKKLISMNEPLKLVGEKPLSCNSCSTEEDA